jgi:ribosome recycling factor
MNPQWEKDFKVRMQKSIESLKGELNRVRTGRASIVLLDGIKVGYYGTPTPLNQVATLAVPESRLITIQPWDASIIGDIEKAILKSELGLVPTSDGKIIRISIPQLTEERRKELVKLVKRLGENAKIAIRNIRRDANEFVKKKEKEKEISQDEMKKNQEDIQKLTDDFIAEIDNLIEQKEKEIMEI